MKSAPVSLQDAGRNVGSNVLGVVSRGFENRTAAGLFRALAEGMYGVPGTISGWHLSEEDSIAFSVLREPVAMVLLGKSCWERAATVAVGVSMIGMTDSSGLADARCS